MPANIAALPVDEARGFPIPWFVYREDDWRPGQPIDLRVADARKRFTAHHHNLCWICGKPLGLTRCVVVGPICLITCTSAEPASHPGCAEWSARHCPFLSRPQFSRSPRAIVADANELSSAGAPILRNPGVACIGYTRKPLELFQANGSLFRLPRKWTRLVFLREAGWRRMPRSSPQSPRACDSCSIGRACGWTKRSAPPSTPRSTGHST
jgi:hypothetical protein